MENSNPVSQPPAAVISQAAIRRWLLIFIWAIPAAYLLFYALTWTRVGPKDFDQFLVFHELQYWNRAMFGFAKQWTPLLCAGLPMSGEPQIPVLSLSMLLTYVLGPLAGIKLASIGYLIIGWVGAYLYAGLWRNERLTRMLAASLFVGNGFFVYRMAVGHIDFVPFLVLPLALWSLHRTVQWQRQGPVAGIALRAVLATMVLAVGIALTIDGSPVAIIHLLFWIGLYALVLSYHERSFAPCVTLACAVAVAGLLDAAYLWPMLSAQVDFPRHTADTFTDPLGLLVHALLPLRGKITHGSGKGHELTVFIGPVLALLIWRYRAVLSLPRGMWLPLLVVSLVSIVLGMGSLRPLHIPQWLSPFDALRSLPGFRSIGVTARYWGFLSLPLSLLGAVAVQRFLSEATAKKATTWLSIALLLQLGSQFDAFWSQWRHARTYTAVKVQDYFHGRVESMSYVARDVQRLQGEFITPTQGVTNCYNMDDFLRAPIQPGTKSVVAQNYYEVADNSPDTTVAVPIAPERTADAQLFSWNHWHVQSTDEREGMYVMVLNQAWNKHWSAEGCDVLRDPSNRLALRCDAAHLRKGVNLKFHDNVSAVGAALSLRAWSLVLILLTGAVFAFVWQRRRSPVSAQGALN